MVREQGAPAARDRTQRASLTDNPYKTRCDLHVRGVGCQDRCTRRADRHATRRFMRAPDCVGGSQARTRPGFGMCSTLGIGNSMVSRVYRSRPTATPLLTIAWSALLVPALSAAPADQALQRVAVFYSAQSIQRPAASALQASLAGAGITSILIELPADGESPGRERAVRTLIEFGPTIAATGGRKATTLALETLPEMPVVRSNPEVRHPTNRQSSTTSTTSNCSNLKFRWS